jgi:Family of unknown function (DUF5681)
MTDDGNDTGGTRGRPFAPGQSGNPAGRPRGSRNRATLLAQALSDDTAEKLIRKAQEMALAGDRSMITLLLKPILRWERPLTFELPDVRTAADAAKVTQMLLDQVAAGEISLGEAERVMSMVQVHLKALEEYDIEQRLWIIEQWRKNQ